MRGFLPRLLKLYRYMLDSLGNKITIYSPIIWKEFTVEIWVRFFLVSVH